MAQRARQVLADRFAPFGTTIFTEMTLLAQKHGAVNLAQGFPDFDGPEFIKRSATEAMGLGGAGQNQYARMFGIPVLNTALAASWEARTGRTIDPDRQVTVTSGCTEAICAAMLGLLNPGDEIILFEPYYDSYRACAAMAGATPRFVTLHAPNARSAGVADAKPSATAPGGEFWFDPAELAAAFTPRTRAILVNTPHNPTGKVFTRAELQLIADLCVEHDVPAITDEVYEHLTFEPSRGHVHLATLPGMAERTLTLSSLGKSFSLTGWKVGWAIGSPELSGAVRAAHQFVTFATATPLQWGAAAAVGLGPEARAAIDRLVGDLAEGRAFLGRALGACGFRVFMPAGAYFIMVDWTESRAGGKGRLGDRFADDGAFCKFLASEVGVAAIPPSVFYEHKEHGRPLARFAFCKKMSTLRQAAERLEKWARG
jgi:N-succinyldiaminopimelate aminotransferase